MDTALRNKWVKALRSGRYHQTVGMLSERQVSNGKEYNCCLGVLCRVARVPDSAHWRLLHQLSDVMADGAAGSMRDQVGISGRDEGTLIDMNDNGEDTFATIADYIERNL